MSIKDDGTTRTPQQQLLLLLCVLGVFSWDLVPDLAVGQIPSIWNTHGLEVKAGLQQGLLRASLWLIALSENQAAGEGEKLAVVQLVIWSQENWSSGEGSC